MSRSTLSLCLVLLATGLGVPSAEAPASLAVDLVGGLPPGGLTATLRLAPEGVSSGTAKPFELTVPVPGEKELRLAAGETWRVEAQAPGTWSEPLLLTPGRPPGDRVTVRLYPAGTLKGKLQIARGEEQPAAVSVRLRTTPAGKSHGLPEAILACPVQDGAMACSAPAGSFDLRFKADSYVPVYLWGLRLAPGATLDLGDLVLKRGASVSGWVEGREASVSAAECRVRLKPFIRDAAGRQAAHERLAATEQEARVDERGFFQVLGVAPGLYELTASQPGLAPAVRAPVEVREGLETQLVEPLVLAKPLLFELSLHPPLDPYGRPWRVELLAGERPAQRVVSAPAPRDGRLLRPEVPPGFYRLEVIDEQGSRWVSQEVTLEAGQSSLAIDVPVVEVRGQVSLGKEPLAATVWLGRKDLRRVRFDSDEEGRFEGFLPAEGTWWPEVASAAEGMRLVLEPVEVERREGKGWAEINLRIPDTVVAGEVVDEKGQKLPHANLLVATLEKQGFHRFRCDEEGKFLLRGLPVGPISVQAREGERESAWVNAAVEDGREGPRLRLAVRRQASLQGRVVSPAGPVPGTRILATSPSLSEGVSGVAEDVAGPQGEFELTLPGDGARAVLILFPPGHALKVFETAVDPGKSLDVAVDSRGGMLILDLSQEQGQSHPLLLHGAWPMPLELLERWARLQGGEPRQGGQLVIPEVGAGEYRLCAGRAAAGALQRGESTPACASGFLLPGGELRLRLPAGSSG